MSNSTKATLFFMVSLFFWACGSESAKIEIPNVDNINIAEFKFERFDRAVNNMDKRDVKQSYLDLKAEFPGLTDLYFNRLLGMMSENEDTFYNKIKDFLSAEEIIAIKDTVEHIFPNTNGIEKDLQMACKLLKYYLPDFKSPHFYTVQTEFGYQSFIFPDGKQNGIGIGLDMFLGEDFEYKLLDPTNPSFSAYLTRTYNKDHIVKKSMEWVVKDLIGDPNGKRFIDLAINNGKKLYLLQKILPTTHDSIIFEYSKSQTDWVKANELEIWSFFLEHELMYETNHLKINKYVSISPDSPGMPKAAPGRTGNYIGLQIVKAYMKRNPDISIQELIEFKDAQKLMELSKYKPKRR